MLESLHVGDCRLHQSGCDTEPFPGHCPALILSVLKRSPAAVASLLDCSRGGVGLWISSGEPNSSTWKQHQDRAPAMVCDGKTVMVTGLSWRRWRKHKWVGSSVGICGDAFYWFHWSGSGRKFFSACTLDFLVFSVIFM